MISALTSLIGPVASLLDKAIPDKDQRERLAHEIATMAEKHSHEVAKAQIEVNKQEAAHKSLFVAGWRPFTGWTCSLALALNFLAFPLLNLLPSITAVSIDMSTMMPVLLGMLGLGGLRSYEKRNGVARGK